jgi:hypothetical protein
MAVNDVLRMICVWRKTIDSPTAINRFHYRQENALVLDTPEDDLWDAFLTKVVPLYRGLVTNQLTLSRVTFGYAPTFETIKELDSLTLSGTATGDPLPPRTSGVITLKTALPTRRGRGRWYMPPGVEAGSAGSVMTATHLTASENFTEAALDTMLAGGVTHANWQLCMWSEADQVARPVTSTVVRTLWGSQRDRRELY